MNYSRILQWFRHYFRLNTLEIFKTIMNAHPIKVLLSEELIQLDLKKSFLRIIG